MKATVTKRTDTHVTFSITVDKAELDHAHEHALDSFRSKVKAKGFRPGKAPDTIVTREIGDSAIQGEVLDHAVSHSYSDAIAGEKVAVIAQPDINVKKWVPYTELEYEATVEVVPPVKLPDYKKIKKPMPPVVIDDAKIDEMVEDLRRRVSKRAPALRAAEMGDEVKFDFAGSRDGKPQEGASGKNYTLKLGSGTFIPGFEEELVGLKAADEKTFDITFPKDYHQDTLAGQVVTFEILMHEVTQLELPEVNDEFAAQIGPFKTVKDLRDDIKDQLQIEGEQANRRDYESELLDELLAKSDMKAPERLVSQQVERMKAEMDQRHTQSGLNMEQYLNAQKQTQAQMEEMIKPEAEKRVKLAMALSEIARAENLVIGADEVEREVEALRMQYTDPAMQQELTGDRVREDVYNHLMSSKVINTLVDYAQEK